MKRVSLFIVTVLGVFGCANQSSNVSLDAPVSFDTPSAQRALVKWGLSDLNSVLGDTEALKQQNFLKLVELAQKAGLNGDPAVQSEQLKVLVYHYLVHRLKSNGAPTELSDIDLKARYEAAPLIRVRHLVLLASSPKEKLSAVKKTEQIYQAFKSGTPFPKLVLKYSDDPASKLKAGDLDFRGSHNFPTALYAAARKTPVGQLSDVVDLGESLHILQIVAVRPFDEAGPPYLEWLRIRHREEQANQFIAAILNETQPERSTDSNPTIRKKEYWRNHRASNRTTPTVPEESLQ